MTTSKAREQTTISTAVMVMILFMAGVELTPLTAMLETIYLMVEEAMMFLMEEQEMTR